MRTGTDHRDQPVTHARVGVTTRSSVAMAAELAVPAGAGGLVVFAHGSGSSRLSPRNQMVAGRLQGRGLATLLMDLLSPAEDRLDARTGTLRFDIGLLAERVVDAIDWAGRQPLTAGLPIGLFGASTGAAAALVAAAERPDRTGAVVSRGGRPDLARDALGRVRAPTLLIVGGDDTRVIPLNEQAFSRLDAGKRIEIVPGAGHLFEEPGALDQVAELAAGWFAGHLTKRAA